MAVQLIDVRNAELNTASITIRTLQVSGKQVTQAVFRQLLERPIVDESNLCLRGTAWGWVNYMIEYRGAINVVWQCGDELRRCVVQFPREPVPFTPEQMPRFYGYAGKTKESMEAEFSARQEAARIKDEAGIAWHLRYNALIAPLFDRPQLFIAV